jgi:NAD(P)-dependent dehydrogenase (short-subunit alcohol dehydrogenase family)
VQELKGKVALVTGGGGGLGEAICYALAEAGVTVVPADIRRELAEKVAAKVCESGQVARGIELDVSHQGSARGAFEFASRTFGRVDFLINNAGIDVTLPIEELSIDDWDRILSVNLRGPFIMSKLALDAMTGRGSGHIVNIVSTASKRAWANASAYHASKWGLLGFSHALHVEARQRGIKVTALVAGGMRTPFLLDRFPELDGSTLQDPRNVAETILFILSQPAETVIPEALVLPMAETSWP